MTPKLPYKRHSKAPMPQKPVLVKIFLLAEGLCVAFFAYIIGIFSHGNSSKISKRGKMIVGMTLGLLFIFFASLYFKNFINAMEISLNETKIGSIKLSENGNINAEYIENMAARIAEEKEGTTILVSDKVSIKPYHAGFREKLVDIDYIANQIAQQMKYKVNATVIKVNGEEMGIINNKANAEKLLADVKESYKQEGENVADYEFVETVVIDTKFVDKREINSSEDVFAKLTEKTTTNQTYIIQSGDTLGKIASKNKMSVKELIALNEGYTETTVLKIGNSVKVVNQKPKLSVVNKKADTATEVVPKSNE